MQCINQRQGKKRRMSFGFSNINPPLKAGAAYKDGSGMGGGGMYFQQGKKKRKDQPDDDIFQRKEESNENDLTFTKEIREEDIPKDAIVNKFVNWFRLNNA
jgi:Mor family transcriptional regulator